jgi:hypothetical protein
MNRLKTFGFLNTSATITLKKRPTFLMSDVLRKASKSAIYIRAQLASRHITEPKKLYIHE